MMRHIFVIVDNNFNEQLDKLFNFAQKFFLENPTEIIDIEWY